ncbi:MAG: hypothetical protein KAH08_02535 [Methylococcales bacterium]|nr:hypothetical protein [Methylococcales bacterium]
MIKKIITLFIFVLFTSSCTNSDIARVANAAAGDVGRVIPGQAGSTVRVLTKNVVKSFVTVIGGQLQLTLQDKQNLEQIWQDENNTQPVSWCSDNQFLSSNSKTVKCKKVNKITATAGKVIKMKDDAMCRIMKTEVENPKGEIATETQNLCQDKAGKWYEKT